MKKLVLLSGLITLSSTVAAQIPMTGTGNNAIDTPVVEFMQQNNIPGLALALVKNGKLVVARGYGVADQNTGEAVTPEHRFRLASISKPITAMGLVKLEESGYISTRDSVLADWLPGDLELAPASQRQALQSISIEQILNHTSGWNFRSQNRELVFEQREIAGFMGVPSPPSPETIIDYGIQFENLHAQPGTEFAYENFNYMLAGRIIETASGRSYEDFMQSQILAPLGINQMRVGQSLENDLDADEVRYHTRGGDNILAASVFDTMPGFRPLQYGGWDQQAIDSLGGWTASAVELARFLSGLDGHGNVPDLLTPETMTRVGRAPETHSGNGDYYGLGWYRIIGGLYHHNGSLPGTATIAAFGYGGNGIVALMNTREEGLSDQLSQSLFQVFINPDSWPDADLFESYGLEEFVVRDEMSGAWFDPAHDGEGFIIEMLDSRRAVVYWFTYDENGRQRWFIGIAQARKNQLVIDELLEMQGGSFGSAPNNISESVIGSLVLDFESCDDGTAFYTVNGETGSQDITRLSAINGRSCAEPGDSLIIASSAEELNSGNWYRPGDPGEGMILQRLGPDSAVLFWFTFDNEGRPAWMVGVGRREDNKWIFDRLEITSGGRFGPGFDPEDVVREKWGSLQLSVECDDGNANYTTVLDTFASETLDVSRLTWLAGNRDNSLCQSL